MDGDGDDGHDHDTRDSRDVDRYSIHLLRNLVGVGDALGLDRSGSLTRNYFQIQMTNFHQACCKVYHMAGHKAYRNYYSHCCCYCLQEMDGHCCRKD